MDGHRSTDASLFVDLPVILSSLTVKELNETPDLCALLVEYSCLELELGDWYSREPSRRNPEEFKSWIAEGRNIFGRRDELNRTARRHRYTHFHQ